MSSALVDLAGLIDGEVVGDPGVRVRDVTHDSRQAGPGTLFVAIPGARHDGHDFAGAAVEMGSPALMVERVLSLGVPQIVVDDTRRAMAPVAAEVHGHPSRRLRLVGVTGTNGKTTVTHMVEAIVAASGRKSGLVGTVHTRVGIDNIHNTRTTPESSDFQRLLAQMADMRAEIVAAEVSSHALAMHRVDSISFAVAAFTNLSQDHLDFHGDLENYFLAKAKLFEPGRSERAVVNIDDPAGRRLLDAIELPVTTTGRDGDVVALERRVGLDSCRFLLSCPSGERAVELAIGGGFNVDNALVAAACSFSLGLSLDDVTRGLASFEGVPGRFEVVSGDDPVRVVVDYAHTPAGIAQAIVSARAGSEGRVVLVFGAGGGRDRAKRPQMGSAATAADIVLVTSDNPRNEDPEAIIDEVMSGMGDAVAVRRQVDRRRAIFDAIELAADGDVVLVLGKGHERGQEIAGRHLPFDDRLVARDALAHKRSRT